LECGGHSTKNSLKLPGHILRGVGPVNSRYGVKVDAKRLEEIIPLSVFVPVGLLFYAWNIIKSP
jgi:hypothetical protein